jgi:diaminopimelate epimerase
VRFTKMNGLGNDFIVMQADTLPDGAGDLAVAMCDRHFGVGGDGMVWILPSERADFRMRIINGDGSEAEQCGNAIRCVGKYVYDHRLTEKTEINIETLAGIQTVHLNVVNGVVKEVRVNMGKPILNGKDIPLNLDQSMVIHQPLEVDGKTFFFTAVSMGNPHAVIEVENAAEFPVERVGPMIEAHPLFPRKTNVEFITVHKPTEITMRVWERGAGQTLACGTGACASVVSSVLNGRTERNVLVHLKGGDLFIEWDENTGCVYMSGPAEEVFQGVWNKV